MNSIWLIDANSYTLEIDTRLKQEKIKYYKVKNLQKQKILGPHRTPVQRMFSVGLLRIATILEHNGYNVKYIHFSDFHGLISGSNINLPDIIAFSAVTPMVEKCAVCSNLIKAMKPETRIVLGGAHANVCREITSERYPVFDLIISGYDVEACAALMNIHPDAVSVPPQYCNYSLLPLPLIEYDINVFSTLGCKYHCEYCLDKFIPYYEKDITPDLDLFIEKLPPRTLLHFFDSVFGYSVERATTLCQKLGFMNHPFLLSCDMRAELITPTFIKALSDAGFKEVRMGIESFDINLLKTNCRTLHPSSLLKAIRYLRDYSDMYITLYSVNGLPGTNDDSCKITADSFSNLLCNRMVDEIKVAQYVPYPVDKVDFSTRGVHIENYDWSSYDRQSFPVYRLKDMTSESIWEWFLLLSKIVADDWAKGLGIDECHLPESIYPEYVVKNYIQTNI